jgi:hypothetical protein
MRNILAVSLILILLGLSVSRADVGQVQGFSFDAMNSAVQTGSAGVTQDMNFAVLGQAQKATDIRTRVTALQSQDAIFGQGAMAGSDAGGAVGVAQTANLVGGQSQDVAGTGPGMQDQALNGNFNQETLNANGIGAALGFQACLGIQVQLVFSPRGASSNGQWLAVGDVVTVGAQP